MNHIFRTLWNEKTGTFVAVSELTKSSGKKASAVCGDVADVRAGVGAEGSVGLTLKTMTAALLMALGAPVYALPSDGAVAAGSATISSSPGNMTINQSSQNAALNWQSFNIGQGEAVQFVQPNSSAVALNRVLGADPSSILGSLSANGQVFLVNPNGILFGQDASVNVGGLVASTLNISDSDFMAGEYKFAGTSAAAVLNQGQINAGGGYVALLGANVSNQGVIAARLGTVALAAGEVITLDVAGDGLLNVAIDQGAVDALVANGGLIQADGGQVLMSAQAAGNLLNTVVNNTGVVQAQTIENRDGVIRLLGDMQTGTVNVAGTLDASAPNGGDGGFIDTSAAHVKIANAVNVTTTAASGKTGTWLIDPVDFTIAASGGDIAGATLSSNLGSTNVLIESVNGGAGTSGDVNVNDVVEWSANKLTLNAENNINVNADMNASGSASLALEFGQAAVAAGNTSNVITHGAAINLPAGTTNFTTKLGSDGAVKAYTVITSLGDVGSTTTTDLQGINGDLAANYALGADIDAAATSGWNLGEGFMPLGNATIKFTGTFEGLGHAVSQLSINRASTDYVGLFGYTNTGAVIQNVGLLDGSIVGGLGGNYVGGLVGRHAIGTINNSYFAGDVNRNTNAGSSIGGLVGRNEGTISDSFADANVGGSSFVGGLVGFNDTGDIQGSYALGTLLGSSQLGGFVGLNGRYGSITTSYSSVAVTSAISQNDYDRGYGGLVGQNAGAISKSYANGVMVLNNNNEAGGLVGLSARGGTASHSFWDTEITGQATSTGGTGLTTIDMQTQANFTSATVANGNKDPGWDFTDTWLLTKGSKAPLLKALMVDVTVTVDDVTKTYDGNIYSGGYSSTVEGHLPGTLSYTGSAQSAVNASSYVITADAASYANKQYVITAIDGTLTINPADLTITSTDVSKTYDAGLSATGSTLITSGSLFGSDSVSGGSFAFTDKNVGTGNKTVTTSGVTVTDGNSGGNYAVSYADNTTSTITQAALTLSTSDVSKTYDAGLGAAGSLTVTGGALFGSDSVSGGTFAYTDKNAGAGNKTVITSGVTVSDGNSGGNYAISYADNTTSTIDPFAVTLTGSRVYDGTVDANADDLTIGTLVGSETLTLNGSGTVADKHVATGKTVALGSLTLADGSGGGLAGNYSFTGGTQITDITKAALTLSTSDVNKTYDGDTTAAGTATVSSGTVFAGDSISGGNFAYTDKNAGSGNKTVTTTGVTVSDGNSGGNYAISYANNTTSTINPYAVSLTGGRVYDGTVAVSADALTIGSLVGSETLTLNGSGTVADKHVANGKTVTLASLTLADGSGGGLASNYSFGGGTQAVDITPTALTLSSSDVIKTYDGDTTASGTATVSSGTVFSGDVLSGGSFAFSEKNVGTGNKTVTTSGVTLTDGNSGGNYAISYADNTTSTIDPFAVSLTGSRGYDGTAAVSAADLTIGSLVGSETLNLTGSGTVADKHVANGKTVTLGSLTLADGSGGGLASNYSFSGGTQITDISQAGLTLATSDVSKTYDGGTTAAGTATVSSGTVFAGDSISGGSFAYTDKNAGTGNKTVTTSGVTVTDGNDGGNYAISYADNTTSTIDPYAMSVTGSRVYDGTVDIASGALTIGTLVGSEMLGLSGSGTVADKHVADGKTVTLGSLTLANGTNGGLASNYSFIGGTQAVDITPAGLTLATADVSKVYDGDLTAGGTVTVTAGTLFGTDAIAGGSFAFTDKNAGTGNKAVTTSGVTLTDGNGGGNYAVSYANNTTSTITQAALTLSTRDVSKTYDAGLGAAGSLTVTGGALFGSDSVSGGTFAYTDKNAGAGNKTVITSGATVSDGNSGSNYSVSYANNTTSTINPYAVSFSGSRVYDGTADVGAADLTIGSLVGSETLNLTGSGTVSDKHVADGKTVALGSLVLADGTNGGLASNYSFIGGTQAVDITPAGLTLATADVSKVYDGDLTAGGTVTVTAGTLFGTDAIAGGSFAFTDKNAGTGNKTVTTSGVTLTDGNSGGNYAVTYADNTTSTINPYAVSLTGGRVYDGTVAVSADALTIGTLVGSETLTLAGNGTVADKHVANGKTVTLDSLALADGTNGGLASNYSFTGGTQSVDITKAALTLSTSDVSKTYDGGTTAAGTATVTAGTLFSGDVLSGGSFAYTDKNAGTGNKTVTTTGVTVTDGNSGGNYAISYADNTTSTIDPFAVSLTGSRVYDGTAAVGAADLAIGSLVDSETLTLAGSGTVTDKHVANGKTVTLGSLALADGTNGGLVSNYSFTGGTQITDITKAALTLSTIDVIKTYDGSTTAAGTATVSSGTVFAGDSISGGSFAYTDKNAGTGNKAVTTSGVTLTDGNGGGNYAVSYADNTTSTITQAALTLSTRDVSKTYDAGLGAAGSLTVTGGALFGSDSVSGGTFAYTDKNAGAGNKTVITSGATVSDGNSGSNYRVSYANNTTSTINPYAVSFSGSRVYDGTADVGAADLTIGSLVGSETLTLNGSGTVADKHVADGKTVALGSLVLADGTNGGLANNYSFSGGTQAVDITPTALTLSSSDVIKTYDGSTTAAGTTTVSSGTVFAGDSISGGNFAYTDKNAGSGNKTVTTTGVTVSDGNSGGNYAVTYADNTISTINPYAVSLTGSRVYDGTADVGADALTIGSLVGSETLNLTGSGTVADKHVANGKTVELGRLALADGANGGLANNYSFSGGNQTVDITPAVLSLATIDVSKTYDGDTTAAGTATVTAGKLFGADTIGDGSFSFADQNVGSGNKTVTTSGVTLSDGNSGGNYKVSYADNTTSTIDPYAVSVTGSRVYDGTADVGAADLTIGSLVGSETLTLAGSGTVIDKHVADGKTVTLGSLTLANGTNGGLASNYSFTGGTQITDITQAALTLATIDVSKTYDGGTSAAGTATVTAGTLFDIDAIAAGSFAFTDKNAGAGDKTITASGVTVTDGNGGGNYAVSYADNTTSTINPFAVSLTGSRVYDGTAAVGAADLIIGDLVGTETLTLNGSGTVADKHVADGKTVTLGSLALANGANGGLASNYSFTGGTQITDITKAALTLSTSDVNKTYDGSTTAAGTATVTAGTLFSGDVLSGGSFAFSDKNVGAGNKTVTTSGVTLTDGNSGGNYAISYADNTTSTINPFAVSLTGSRGYDGTAAVSAADLTIGSLVGSETLNLTGSGTVADKHVANGKTVTLGSLTLADGANGGLASNYSFIGGSQAVDITPAGLTLSTGDVSKTYDGSTTAAGTATVSSGTVFAGDSISGGNFAYTDKNAGSGNKTVTTTGVTVSDGNSGGNYKVSYADNTTSTIDPYAVSLTGSRVYDGTADVGAADLTIGSLVGSETLTLNGSGTVADKHVADGKTVALGSLVLADGTNGGLASNYSFIGGTQAVDITPADLTLATGDVSKTFDGNLIAAGTPMVTAGTLFSTDAIAGGSFVFTDPNVGIGNKTVSTLGVILADGNNGGNYNVTYADNTGSSITTATLLQNTRATATSSATSSGVSAREVSSGPNQALPTPPIANSSAMSSLAGLNLVIVNEGIRLPPDMEPGVAFDDDNAN